LVYKTGGAGVMPQIGLMAGELLPLLSRCAKVPASFRKEAAMATAATYPQQLGRFRCSDSLGVRDGSVIGWTRPVARVRDQEEPEEENGGKLVCRIVEDKNGNMHVLDAGKLRLRARRGRDGTLEIRHLSEETGDEADPDIVGEHPGLGGDPAAAVGRTGDALAAWHRSGRSEFHAAALSEYQRKLDEHYSAR
jgi:hypothetical protein